MKRLLFLTLIVLPVPLPAAGQPSQGLGEPASLDPKAILREVGAWIARAKDKNHQAALWSLLGSEQIKLGERKAAADSFQRAFAASNALEDYAKARYLVFLVEQQAAAGEISAAFDSAEELGKLPRELNFRAQAWGAIAAAQARAGDIQAAITNVRNIEDPDSDGPKALALEVIAEAQVKAGDTLHGVKTAQSIPDAYLRVRCLGTIALLRYETDKADGKKILQEAVEAVKEAGKNDQRWRMEVEIIRTTAAMGEFEEAMRLARELPEPERFQALALSYIAAEQARAKDFSGAFKTARAIPRQTARDSALLTIALEQSPADALKTLQELTYDYFRVEGLLAVAQQEAKAGRKRASEEVFREAYRLAEGVTDPPNMRDAKMGVLRSLARAQGQAGFGEAARAWIDQQSSPDARAFALIGLAQGLASR